MKIDTIVLGLIYIVQASAQTFNQNRRLIKDAAALDPDNLSWDPHSKDALLIRDREIYTVGYASYSDNSMTLYQIETNSNSTDEIKEQIICGINAVHSKHSEISVDKLHYIYHNSHLLQNRFRRREPYQESHEEGVLTVVLSYGSEEIGSAIKSIGSDVSFLTDPLNVNCAHGGAECPGNTRIVGFGGTCADAVGTVNIASYVDSSNTTVAQSKLNEGAEWADHVIENNQSVGSWKVGFNDSGLWNLIIRIIRNNECRNGLEPSYRIKSQRYMV
ncbi:hypothetical protein G9P44_000791 [Scheffersomyces stipitis]|nr:hypothetical protein G9P44_000791 [Scheffersomyces stipitis]